MIEVGPTPATPLLITVPAEDAEEASRIIQETQKFRSTQSTTRRGWWWGVALFVVGPLVVIWIYILVNGLLSWL